MASTDKQKMETLAKTFAKVHSIENLSDKLLKRRQELNKMYENVCMEKQEIDSNG